MEPQDTHLVPSGVQISALQHGLKPSRPRTLVTTGWGCGGDAQPPPETAGPWPHCAVQALSRWGLRLGRGGGAAGSSSAERGGVDPNGRRGEAAGCPWVSAPGGCGHGVDRCNRGLLREGGGNAGKTKEKGSALWGPRRHGTSPRGRDGLPEPRAGALGPPSDGTVRETARNAPLGVLELHLPDRQATLRIRLHGDPRRGRRRRAAQRPSASRMLAAHGSAGRSGDRVARPPEDLTPTCPRLERHLLCRKHSRTRSPRARRPRRPSRLVPAAGAASLAPRARFLGMRSETARVASGPCRPRTPRRAKAVARTDTRTHTRGARMGLRVGRQPRAPREQLHSPTPAPGGRVTRTPEPRCHALCR